ncbi:pantoate--beta-alanine ligase [Candidatus Pelagibacter sp.]|nr:pantoate--beta-alanine ligase [Candidatus Pelagibacter sp.]
MFYLLILLLQMKLIRQITDLNKAVNKEKNLGFVPTMGALHKGHGFLINKSKRLCKKTLVSVFVNPTQFNNKNDYKSYPRNLTDDLKILKKLKVDFVYLPTVKQIYKEKLIKKISLKKSQKILCAKFRKGHFEGVLDVLNRFIKLINPKVMFMGEKDFQQYFLTQKYISKKYTTKVYLCKTIRDSNGVALSSRNKLLKESNFKKLGLIAKKLINSKMKLYKLNRINNDNSKKFQEIIQTLKQELINEFNIKIEYLECRNLINLSTNIKNKKFKFFISYYIDKVRLIDNF